MRMHARGDGSEGRLLDAGVQDLDTGKFELIEAMWRTSRMSPRKNDLNDATWIVYLSACGLIKASFVPNEEVQESRALTRTPTVGARADAAYAADREDAASEYRAQLGDLRDHGRERTTDNPGHD